MAKAQGEIDVVMGADSKAVMATMDKIVRRMEEMQRIANGIQAAADKAAKAFNFQPNAKKFDDVLRKFEAIEKRMQDLARAPVTAKVNDKNFAGQVRAATEFSRPLKQAQNEAQALQTRLYAIDKQLVELGNKGKTGNQGLMSKRLGLEQTQKDIAKLQADIKRADDAFSKLGVSGSRGRLNAAEQGLFGALTNGRRSNFTREIEELRQARNEYLRELEKTKRDIAKAQRDMNAPAPGGGKGGGLFGSGGIGGVILRTGAYGAAAAAIYGVVGALKDGIDYAIKFEDQMAKISAIANLTGTQTAGLATTISEVGSKSRYATMDIAEATTVLAQAGFTAEDIKGSLAAVGNLASASGVTFAEATDVITSAIGSFQLQASEASRITDVLSSALNSTKLNIQQVALGIQYAGATAYEQKISFEELTAVMATMANAGIRSGSTIGTGLRQFLVDLQTPSKKLTEELKALGLGMDDIDVKTLGLPEVLNRLAEAGFSSANAYRALETRAAAAYIVLKNNRDEIQKQIIAQNQVGLAAEAAAKGQDSLSAQWQRFKNILNDATSNAIAPAGKALKELLHKINELASDTHLKKMVEDLNDMSRFSEEWYIQRNAIDAYIESKKRALEIEYAHAASMEEANTRVNEANDAFAKQQTVIDTASDAVRKLILREQQLTNDHLALQAETATLRNRFAGLAQELDGNAISYDNLVLAMQRYRAQAIAIGALKANDQRMAYDQRVRAGASKANDYSREFMSTKAYRDMPSNLKTAMARLAANPDGPTAGNDASLLYDYATKNKDKMGGADTSLIGFARTTSRVGTDKLARNDAKNNFDTYSHLSTKAGKQLMAGVDSLSGKSDAEIKSWISTNIDSQLSPNASPSVVSALEMLRGQALAQLGSGAGPQEPKAADKKERGGRDPEREEDKKQLAIMQQRLKATNAELDLAIKNIAKEGNDPSELLGENEVAVTGSKGLSKSKILGNLKKADASLTKWITDRTSLMEAEIDSKNMTGEDAEMFRAEVAREIEAMKDKTKGEITEGLIGAMEVMIEAVTKIKEKAEEAADQALALSEARMTALERSNMRGRVPDYVKNFYGRRIEEDTDRRDYAQIGINQKAISGLQGKKEWWQDLFDKAEAEENTIGMATVRIAMEDLESQILTLTNANDVLKASFNGESLLPKSFGESLGMIVEDFREANNLGQSFKDTLLGDFPAILEGASAGITTFFTDIISGTATVKQAFGSFAKSMIQMLQQMVAKFVAMQIFKLLLSFLPGAPSGASAAMASIAGGGGPPGDYHGGHVKGAYRGEHIQTGAAGRDSTLRNLARGEYVVRKAAVDSVGVGFMKNLNERGAHAVRPAPIVMPKPANQEMSVYVVAPEQKPQMGARDVLLILHDDILKEGQTKKLIKHVAQGG